MWQFIDVNIEPSCAVIGTIAVIIIAIVSLRISKKVLTQQTLVDLLKEYRSPQMCFAIQELWSAYREKCQSNKDEWISYYKDKYEEEYLSKFEERQYSLHYQRRIVSQFYQQVATLYYKKILPKKVVRVYWTDLEIIEEILKPIDKDAMQDIIERKSVKEVENSVDQMIKLCNEFKPLWKKFKINNESKV